MDSDGNRFRARLLVARVLCSLAWAALFYVPISAQKLGSNLSSIQDLCIEMHNYIIAHVNWYVTDLGKPTFWAEANFWELKLDWKFFTMFLKFKFFAHLDKATITLSCFEVSHQKLFIPRKYGWLHQINWCAQKVDFPRSSLI